LLVGYDHDGRKVIDADDARESSQIIERGGCRNQCLIGLLDRFVCLDIANPVSYIDRSFPTVTVATNRLRTGIPAILHTENTRTETAISAGEAVGMAFGR
jgi:hypothetical protein